MNQLTTDQKIQLSACVATHASSITAGELGPYLTWQRARAGYSADVGAAVADDDIRHVANVLGIPLMQIVSESGRQAPWHAVDYVPISSANETRHDAESQLAELIDRLEDTRLDVHGTDQRVTRLAGQIDDSVPRLDELTAAGAETDKHLAEAFAVLDVQVERINRIDRRSIALTEAQASLSGRFGTLAGTIDSVAALGRRSMDQIDTLCLRLTQAEASIKGLRINAAPISDDELTDDDPPAA